MRRTYNESHLHSLYGYSIFQLLKAQKWTLMTSDSTDREGKMRILLQSMVMVLDNLESTCTPVFQAISNSNMKLYFFAILTSYCGEIPGGKDISGIWYVLSVRRSCLGCLSTIQDIRKLRCMRARNMADISRARARK